MEERFELVTPVTPNFNSELQLASHQGRIARLEEYQRATGLPLEEYASHLEDPDGQFLRSIRVLLLVGEKDRLHWKVGGPANTLERFVTDMYARTTAGARLVLIPKYTHMGHWALHNEKFVYLWLWALRSGYFGPLCSDAM